jgi:hypothetical protein
MKLHIPFSRTAHIGRSMDEDDFARKVAERDALMRAAAARAEEHLQASGMLEVEIEARKEIDRLVREMVAAA